MSMLAAYRAAQHVRRGGGGREREASLRAQQRRAPGGALISGQFFGRRHREGGLPEEGPWPHNGKTLTNPLEQTMAPRALYQRLCQQLQACMPGLGVWPTRRLALIVTGLLLARHAALPRLAAQLRRATPATWSLCAAAGRHAADRPLHVEHAGAGLRRPRTAAGVVPLVGQTRGPILAADRPAVRAGHAYPATAGPAGIAGRSWPELTETNQAGASARLGLRAARAKRDHVAHRATRGTAGASGRAGPAAWCAECVPRRLGLCQVHHVGAHRGGLERGLQGAMAVGQQSGSGTWTASAVCPAHAGRGAVSRCEERRLRVGAQPRAARRSRAAAAARHHARDLVRRITR